MIDIKQNTKENTLTMSITISADQAKVLHQKYYRVSSPYGTEVRHISLANEYSENKQQLFQHRLELVELGLLSILTIDSTLKYYEITEIGQMFMLQLKKQ